ncbi:MAG TPA: threonine/serine exporter family protein [Myxococcota bacterium]|nr:threonine/serine exporter family protein [Myxococcota bacterium]
MVRTPKNIRRRARFLVELAKALHGAGLSAHRMEAVLEGACRPLGVEGRFFATPTAVLVQVDGEIELLRTAPSEVCLERIVELDLIARDLGAGRLGARAALRRLHAVLAAPARWSVGAVVGAFGMTSATSSVLFGGVLEEVVASGLLGTIVGALAAISGRSPHISRLFPMAAAAMVATAARGLAVFAPLRPEIVVLASLIVLLPGFSLTIALAELATGHLASGTARAMGAGMSLLQLTVGTALGFSLGAHAGQTTAVDVVALASWVTPLAVAACAAALVVLFRAHPSRLPVVVAVCFLAFFGTGYAAELVGTELGPFLGSFMVALGSNLYARWRRVPASVPLMPGLLMLVPGSVGFRAARALADRQVLDGVDIAFQTCLIAAALVSGILAANALVNPRSV